MNTKKAKAFFSKLKTDLKSNTSLIYWISTDQLVKDIRIGRNLPTNILINLVEHALGTIFDSVFTNYNKVNELELKYVETEAVHECKVLIQKMMKTDISLSCSVLLYGNPGVGKTFVVDSLASEFQDWKIVNFKISEMLSKDKDNKNSSYDPSNIDEYDHQRMIVVFDEIDKEINDSNISIFLKKIDIIRKSAIIKRNRKILIIMTSNKPPEKLPEALVRPGRVSKWIKVENWTEKEAKEFSRIFDIPFEVLTPNKDGTYLAGQCFEDAQEYILSKL